MNIARSSKSALKTCRFAFDYVTQFGSVPRHARGQWLSKRVVDLGPTYIKMAQFVANRKDIVDKDIACSFRKLQDNVQPMEALHVQEILAETRRFVELKIDEEPFASASIAQVHRGSLVDTRTGCTLDVAVKLRRHGIRAAIDADISVLLFVLNLFRHFGIPDIDESIKIVKAFQDMIVQETDFVREVDNMRAFVESNDGMMRSAQVPTAFAELCSEEVIVMEYVPSVRFDSLEAVFTKEQRSEIAYELMDQVVLQFLEGGVMHGDPHGGNVGLSIRPEHVRGSGATGHADLLAKIVYYDFGNVVRVDARVRSAIKSLIFELMIENVPGVRRLLLNWPDLLEIKDVERTDVYIDMYIKYMKTIDFAVFKSSSSSSSSSSFFSSFPSRSSAFAASKPASSFSPKEVVPIRMNGKLLEIMRVFGLVEGICMTLDPDFSYSNVFVKHADSFLFDSDFLFNKASSDFENLIMMK